MAIFQRLFEKRDLTSEKLVQMLMEGQQSYTGRRVSEEGSLTNTAVYACVRIISESLASLPLVLFRTTGRSRRRATEHPLYPVLHDMANPEMTAFEWREFTLSKTLLWGNSYSEIEYNRAGDVVALWPLLADKMEEITRDDSGQKVYHYRMPGGDVKFFPDYKIHHLHGLGYDGVLGYSPIRMAMQAVGLSLATEEFGSRFFSNGARMSGVLTHPGRLSEDAQMRLSNSMSMENAGLSNAHRIRILEEGMQWQPMTIPPEEAQFLETRKFQTTEIARVFRVPPHMLADLDRATFSNIEHQGLEFTIHTLRPWIVRHEQAIKRDLLTSEDRVAHKPSYIVDGLLRGDIKTRYEAYSIAVQNGWLNRNEVRELEDRNPEPELDEYLVPLNMIEAGQQAAPEPVTEEPRHEHYGYVVRDDVEPAAPLLETRARDNRQALLRRHVRLFEDAAGRLVRREVADIRRALPRQLRSRDAEGFLEWLAEFYADLRGVIPGYFRALLLTYAESMLASVADELDADEIELSEELRTWIEQYLENYATVYAVGSERQLRALVRDAADAGEDVEAAVVERMDGWEDTKPGKEGLGQAFEAGNALAIFGYGTAGVAYLRWSARGDSCPLCQKLDGTRIPISGAFVDKGDIVEADGVDPLPIVRTIKHGPLHGGCDCVVIAG